MRWKVVRVLGSLPPLPPERLELVSNIPSTQHEPAYGGSIAKGGRG